MYSNRGVEKEKIVLKRRQRSKRTTHLRIQSYVLLHYLRLTGMTCLHQTYLGFTATKSLTIVGLELSCNASTTSQGRSTTPKIHPSSYLPTREAFLFRLPNELLLSIVEFAICDPCSRSQAECDESAPRDNACVAVLSRVCHRLTRIAQPLLFRTIRFKHRIEIVPPAIPVIKLHRTLTKNAELRQYCRYVAYVTSFEVMPSKKILHHTSAA
jgi:hypothetical protein